MRRLNPLLGAACLAMAVGCLAPAELPARTLPDTAACSPDASEGVECGTVTVPEDRAVKGGRLLLLRYARIRGEEAAATAPLFLLAGGPGQGAVEQGLVMLPILRSLHKGDIVLLDQRGTGASNPLTCEGGFWVAMAGRKEVEECLESLRPRADVRFYATPDAVADLDAMRQALGYDRIDLFGVSYGTRVATAYMRAHPNRVRAALLRAAAPPDFNITVEGSISAQAELDRMFGECRASATCSADFPAVERQLDAINAGLERKPATVQVQAPTGVVEEVSVTPDLFNAMIYAMLLSAQTRQMIPSTIATIATSGFQPVAPILSQVRNAIYAGLPVGMYLSVVCSEDAPRISAAERAAKQSGLLAGIADTARTCAYWPKRRLPGNFFDPLRVETPTLILTGSLDPATTASAAERLLATLPASKHVILPATAHGPPVPSCAIEGVAAFLRTAAVEAAKVDCSALKLSPFARPKSATPAQRP